MRPRFCKYELTLACCAVLLQVVKKESKPKKKEPKVQSSPAKGTSSKVRPKGWTDKDWLIERYLVRWWYCEEWPPADRPRPIDLSEDFVEMEHYPYIYKSTTTGQIVNKRNEDNRPPCKQVAGERGHPSVRHPRCHCPCAEAQYVLLLPTLISTCVFSFPKLRADASMLAACAGPAPPTLPHSSLPIPVRPCVTGYRKCWSWGLRRSKPRSKMPSRSKWRWVMQCVCACMQFEHACVCACAFLMHVAVWGICVVYPCALCQECGKWSLPPSLPPPPPPR